MNEHHKPLINQVNSLNSEAEPENKTPIDWQLPTIDGVQSW